MFLSCWFSIHGVPKEVRKVLLILELTWRRLGVVGQWPDARKSWWVPTSDRLWIDGLAGTDGDRYRFDDMVRR